MLPNNEPETIAGKNDLRNTQAALESYYIDKSEYPLTEQGLVLLVPTYLTVVPQDPHGTDYEYVSNGKTYSLIARLENEHDPSADSVGQYLVSGVGK